MTEQNILENEEKKDGQQKEADVTAEEIINPESATEEETTNDGDDHTSAEEKEETLSMDYYMEKVKKLENDINSLKNYLSRERADFTNYKKRTLTEKEELKYFISGNLLSSLLPAMDSFDQLFSQNKNQENSLDKFIEGVKMIQRQIISTFQEYGLETIDPAGEEFNPSSMEALNMTESGDVEKETVTGVFQKGYKIKDKIIRPARVMVAKPKPAQAEHNTENAESSKHQENQ